MKTLKNNDEKIKTAGIDALNKSLGPAKALRFLALLHREPTDYVKVSRKLYQHQTIDDIFKRAGKSRKNHPPHS